jgi:hypothetical protein
MRRHHPDGFSNLKPVRGHAHHSGSPTASAHREDVNESPGHQLREHELAPRVDGPARDAGNAARAISFQVPVAAQGSVPEVAEVAVVRNATSLPMTRGEGRLNVR